MEDRVDGTNDTRSHCRYGVGLHVIFIGLIVPRKTGILIQLMMKVPKFEVIDVGMMTVHVREAAARCRCQGSVRYMRHTAIEQLLR